MNDIKENKGLIIISYILIILLSILLVLLAVGLVIAIHSKIVGLIEAGTVLTIGLIIIGCLIINLFEEIKD